jgi:hypothetical protein
MLFGGASGLPSGVGRWASPDGRPWVLLNSCYGENLRVARALRTLTLGLPEREQRAIDMPASDFERRASTHSVTLVQPRLR